MKEKLIKKIKIILKFLLLILSILFIFAFVSIMDSLTIRGSLLGLMLITVLLVLCGCTIHAKDLIYIKNIFSRN